MYSKMIDAYIQKHQTDYQPKYCYHSCDRLDEKTFKFHYYVRDPQLLQIDIFLEIHLGNEVEVKVLEDLHEHECDAIAIDALNRVRGYTNRKTTIAPSKMAEFVANPIIRESLTAQDMIYVLDYIEYHEGKNPDAIYTFYSIYLKYFEMLIEKKRYKDMSLSFDILLDEILYEVMWVGINTKYLDQEHFMHQAYIRSIINMMNPCVREMYEVSPERIAHMIWHMAKYWRFSISIYTSLEGLIMDYPDIVDELMEYYEKNDEKIDLNQTKLVFRIFRAVHNKDEYAYRKAIIEVLKLLMADITTVVNHEEQEQVGLIFLKQEGFDILLELFDETFDASIYTCFPIAEIPKDLHPFIKKQLEEALKYYAKKMNDPSMRMESLGQIATLNTLLIENF